MNIDDVVRNFSTTPFLFVGSGFSRRYYNLPDWKGLLQVFAQRLSNDEFAYDAYENKARVESFSTTLYAKVASLIEQDFNERWYKDSSFRQIDSNETELVRKSGSPFRVEVSHYIREHSHLIPGIEEEIKMFRMISERSISGIITTNFDELLETITDNYHVYIGQEELVFSPIQGLAEIYKIHGCITQPNLLILTDKDYLDFNKSSPYLASKLMTIFMEYPIIFLGYSITDPNIQTILHAIVNCLSEENLKKLQNRFMYIEWKSRKQDIDITPYSINLNGKVIDVTRIQTDNFLVLYKALQNKKSTLPVKVLRMFKQEFYNYALTNQPSATIRVAGIEDNNVHDDDLVLAIGKASALGLRGLKGLEAEEWFRNIVLDDLEFTADEILENAYPTLIAKNNKLPLNKLLQKAMRDFPDCREKADKTFDSTLNATIKRNRGGRYIPIRSVSGILASDPIEKAIEDIAHLEEYEIDVTELENFLRKKFSEPGFYISLSRFAQSGFKRLVRIYDYLKYGR